MSGVISCEQDFAKERTFFMNKLKIANAKQIELEAKIEELQTCLANEKDFNLKIFVDEKVTQLCQRAYFSYEQFAAEQHAETCLNSPATDRDQCDLVKEMEVRMEYEKKISEQIVVMLEKKLSSFVSEVKSLKEKQAQEV